MHTKHSSRMPGFTSFVLLAASVAAYAGDAPRALAGALVLGGFYTAGFAVGRRRGDRAAAAAPEPHAEPAAAPTAGDAAGSVRSALAHKCRGAWSRLQQHCPRRRDAAAAAPRA